MKTFLGCAMAVVSCLWFGLLMATPPLAQSAPLVDDQAQAPLANEQTPAVLANKQVTSTLAISVGIAAATGYSVTVPVSFQSGGNTVGSTTFSIDFDESCLAFNERDGNNDGRPDAVRSNVPLAFRLSVSYNGEDTDGELDIVIADYSLPIASLPDHEALLTVSFTARCLPAAGQIIAAPVLFSRAPVASFGDANGVDVAGATHDGSVAIQAEPLVTPTPSATPTPGSGTPSATPTGTDTPSPGTPSATPTATPTITPTPGPGTPSATPTLIPTAGPGTPTITPTPPQRLYLPIIKQGA